MSRKPELNETEKLNQLSKKELVEMILAQHKIIEHLEIEIEKLNQQCQCCGEIRSPQWSNQIVPGQDLGIKLQA
jgi:hypothetical protein